jgi:dTDP-4-amino-4,6-dideoxygalactose transaminase
MKTVPFLDLKAQYAAIRHEIRLSMDEVFNSASFVGGPIVENFEKEFADFCGCGYAASTSNGTSALWMTLLSLGIGQGDEVITVPNTFIATAEAITFSGARPVFVDVEEQSYTMNPTLLEKAITPKTKAVIPVHLFGQPADMDPILEIAKRRGLFVVEDACQAHGALYKGKEVGTIGDAGCFSFYPGKNLGAYGEAGAVVTNDPELAEKIKILRDHGQSRKYYHKVIGWNGRMDGLQGAVLRVKLKYLPAWNEARRKKAGLYNSLLTDMDEITLPSEMDYARHVYHLYVIRTRRRDDLKSYLAERGIECGIHYPVPIHLQEAYRHFGIRHGAFPVAEKCAEELLSLPMYPELTEEQIGYVAAELRNKLSLS